MKLDVKKIYGLVILLVLSGCQTIGPSKLVGKTPLTISSGVFLHFEEYKASGTAAAYAVSIDGQYAYASHCDYTSCDYPEGSAALQAITNCDKKNSQTCKLFALTENIVWEGPISYPSFNKGENPLILNVKTSGQSTTSYMGVAKFNTHKTSASLAVKIKNTQCEGSVYVERKRWSITCAGEKRFSGSLGSSSRSLFWGTSDEGAAVLSILKIPQSTQANTGIRIDTASPVSRSTSNGSKNHRLVGRWDGVSNDLTGTFTTDSNSGRGRLKVQFDRDDAVNANCSGQWLWGKGKYNTATLPEGTWSLACDDGLTAGGTYVSSVPSDGTIEGEDAKGRKISMSFSPVNNQQRVGAESSGKDSSIEERLGKLKALVDDGLLTEKEASEKRAEILDGL